MLALEIVFWTSIGLLAFTHVGYPMLLALISRRDRSEHENLQDPPTVSLIIAAYNEEAAISQKIANSLALSYPRDRLQLIVFSDGSTDRTVELAKAAGADLVLDLPRQGKTAAQNAAVEQSTGEIIAFSDANSVWHPDALARLASRLGEDGVGYVCGQVVFQDAQGDNQEGLYWRYEMWIRERESALAGVTAGNGAIYATRRESFVALDPHSSHDLSLPPALTRRGWRCEYEPDAMADETLVPTLEGEFTRKRRMGRGLWDVLVGEGTLSPRGYPPLYAFEIFAHRALRYSSPLLHVLALGANLALLGQGTLYVVTLALQAALLAAAALAGAIPLAPLKIARYYVLVTASIAAGLWDRFRLGPQAAWERVEGAR